MIADAAARMDRMYARQRHIYDLTRKFYLLGRDRLIDRLPVRHGDHVIEIGCGTGRNLVALARRHRGVHLYGLDASAEMLATAQGSLARARLSDRVRLAQGLAEDLKPGMFGLDQRFDAIVLSYVLSMIPDWRAALEQAIVQLRPGGCLAVVDFGDQAALPGWFRRGLREWLALFDVTPRDELGAYLERTTRARGGDLVDESLWGGYARRFVYRPPAQHAPGA